MAEFSHCACANVTLLGRVAKRCQHHPTISNNTQHFWPKSNFAQHYPTIPNITQQCPTWVAKRSQHLYPTMLAFVGQKCWHRLARALDGKGMISKFSAGFTQAPTFPRSWYNIAIGNIDLQSKYVITSSTVFPPIMNLKNNIHRQCLLQECWCALFSRNEALPLKIPSWAPDDLSPAHFPNYRCIVFKITKGIWSIPISNPICQTHYRLLLTHSKPELQWPTSTIRSCPHFLFPLSSLWIAAYPYWNPVTDFLGIQPTSRKHACR